jgi:hypothetical protein
MNSNTKTAMNLRLKSVAIVFGVVAACLPPASAQDAPGIKLDSDATARIEKASSDPFRWIILHTKPRANTPKPAQAAPAPAPQAAAKPAPKNTTRRNNQKPELEVGKPTETAQTQPATDTANTIASSAVGNESASVMEGDLIHEVIDFDTVKSATGSNIEDHNGATTSGLNTFSFNSPSPVKAALNFDDKRKLMRVDYDVPETVGQYGGAGFRVAVAEGGKSMGALVKGEKVDGMLVIEVDSSVKTHLKIFIAGPTESANGAFPFFRLPVEPGLRTYGLMLADFITPPWDAAAPTISQTLSKVLGVGVEYSRGDAVGEGDKGTFWVGNIRFSNTKQVVAGK